MTMICPCQRRHGPEARRRSARVREGMVPKIDDDLPASQKAWSRSERGQLLKSSQRRPMKQSDEATCSISANSVCHMFLIESPYSKIQNFSHRHFDGTLLSDSCNGIKSSFSLRISLR
ncbi:hypothetical protein DKX38_004172 [Salix brachista]|uniref:Uncharacterized protein n=1 Tax=Salix brachista TaxID=2182728 RepID=A0A5N5NAM7_9ROSI|nr:hypothetical protein DKX38_004172 [Salix brachista]